MSLSNRSIIGKFRRIAHALNKTGGYNDGTYLVQYASETDEQYQKRRDVAWFGDEMMEACATFAGYLAKRPPARQNINNPLLAGIVEDCNWRGDSLDVFWQSFIIEAAARGSMLLLVDMPRALPDNQQAQLKQRAFPYLVMINPEDVTSYALNHRGILTMVEIKQETGNKTIVRGWDELSWWEKDGDAEETRQDHGLGVCPVLAFTEKGDYPSLGHFAGLEPMICRLYNMRSEFDEILRRHTFPIFNAQFPLIEPAQGESPESANNRQMALIKALQDGIKKLGSERGIVTPGPCSFIAPPDGPARTYQEAIKELEEKIDKKSLNVNLPNGAEAGISLTLRFQSLNSALVRFARRMEDLERRMWDIAALWLKINNTIQVDWAKDYALADTEREIAILQQMEASNMPEPVIIKQKETVINAQFPMMQQEERDEMTVILNEGNKER